MSFSLPLQHLIANLHLEEVNAPSPQPTTTGALSASNGPFLFALYTFIHGETLAEAYPMSVDLVQQIGQALATLHAVQFPKVLQSQFPQDILTAPFDADLLTDLVAVEAISTRDASYLQRLREVIWPRREYIRAFLAQSQEYARKAQQVATSPVICHGDAWGGNMILAPSGQLTLLDWESAVIAPPERDAFLYLVQYPQSGSKKEHHSTSLPALSGYQIHPNRSSDFTLGYIGPAFTAFDDGYRMIHKEPMRWHLDWLAYYAYRLQLRNLAQWLHNLLHEPLNEVQRNNDVTMIEYHCLDRLESVERTVTDLMTSSADGCI